jgi:hypothetical protein
VLVDAGGDARTEQRPQPDDGPASGGGVLGVPAGRLLPVLLEVEQAAGVRRGREGLVEAAEPGGVGRGGGRFVDGEAVRWWS